MTTQKSTLWITGALIVALGGAGTAALARDGGHGDRGDMGRGGPMMAQMFTDADADGDGKVTKDEMAAAAAKRFTDADTNSDGKLSAEELQAQAEAQRAQRQAARMVERSEQMIARFDYDKDGMLSQQEMQAMRPADMFDRMLERLDTDKDGALSKAEMEQAQARMQDKRGGHGDRDGKGGKGHHDGKRWFQRGGPDGAPTDGGASGN